MTDQTINKKFLVRYKNETYDIAKFVQKHPGGRNTLNLLPNTDIDYKFDQLPHSIAAKYLIKEYKIQSQTNNNDIQSGSFAATSNRQNYTVNTNKHDADDNRQIEKHLNGDSHQQNRRNSDDKCESMIKIDESMEVR